MVNNNSRQTYYRKFLVCSFSGAIGDFMTITALNWYVADTMKSAWMLGLVSFFRIMPSLFMGFAGGYWADKMDKRSLIIRIYSGIILLSLVQAIIITTLPYGRPMWFALLVVVFLRSLLDGAEPSVRNALLPDIVDKSYIASAVGYYTSSLNLARIIAPAIAGFCIAASGNTLIFWIDVVVQLPALLVLFYLPKSSLSQTGHNNSLLSEENAATGFTRSAKFIRNSPLLLSTVCLSIWMMLLLFPYNSMLSLYVEHLHLNAGTFGLLSGVTAAGAILSGFLPGRISMEQQMKLWPWTAITASMLMIALGLASHIAVIYIIVFFLGLLSQSFRNTNRIIFQVHSPQDIRGKVMAIILSDRGFIAVGLLCSTWLTTITTIGFSFVAMGITALGGALLLYFMKYKKAVNTAAI